MSSSPKLVAAKPAGATLSDLNKAVAVADIKHYGEQLIVPTGMKIPEAIDLLKRREHYLNEEVEFTETFNVFPWDGAYSFSKVLQRRYGWVPAERTPGFFGSKPPKMISVEVGPGKTEQVAWGRVSLPGMEGGYIDCGSGQKDGMIVFAIRVCVLRVNEEDVRALLEEVRNELNTNSIYNGKAIKLRFLDDDGDVLQMPEPKFIDTDDINPDDVIYSDALQHQVQTSLYTPISRVKDCIANGISVKRGVLLGGTYGTGKTLAAKVASKLAVDNGLTYIYIPHADELAHAIRFAQQYQSPACVIFCEDIDRELDGDRSVAMDDILNIIDGIDTKSSNMIVVMTTNDLSSINAAMLRPGRLDAVIEVTPPDAKAIEKLLRMYGGSAIDSKTDLSKAAKILDGNIPAVIAEVVKRAKLAQLALQPAGTLITQLSEEALIEASSSMAYQMHLLASKINEQVKIPTLDDHFTGMIHKVLENNTMLTDASGNIHELHRRLL